jgi:hypothetical protein
MGSNNIESLFVHKTIIFKIAREENYYYHVSTN